MTKAAVAGTFDILHDGHKALLSRAFEVGDTVVVGITSDRMAGEGREVSVPLHLRKAELERYLSGKGDYRVFEIEVVSEETLGNGRILNDRRASRGLKPFELSVVPLVRSDDGSKISATSILRGEYGRSGHRSVMDVAVGSLNPVKVSAVRSVMERVYGEVRRSGSPPSTSEAGCRRSRSRDRPTRAPGTGRWPLSASMTWP